MVHLYIKIDIKIVMKLLIKMDKYILVCFTFWNQNITAMNTNIYICIYLSNAHAVYSKQADEYIKRAFVFARSIIIIFTQIAV